MRFLDFLKKLLAVSVMIVLFVPLSCDNLSPEIYGNDGALLAKIDVADALALISERDPERTFRSQGHTWYHETLLKFGPDGSLTPAEFTLTGKQNGGFDWYTVNDLGTDYFLISFYRRSESYIIDKHSGNATKSTFIEVDDLVVEDKQSWGIYQNKKIIYRDIHSRHFSVENFLLAGTAMPEPGVIGLPERWVFDRDANPYFIYAGSLYYYNDNKSTKIANGLSNVWNDKSGNLFLIDFNGVIYIVLNGELTKDVELGLPLTSARVRAFNFPEGKTYAILPLFTGSTILYDLEERISKGVIENGDEYFEILAADTYNDQINLLVVRGTNRELVTINISGESPEIRVEVVGISQPVRENGIFTLQDNLTLIEVANSNVPDHDDTFLQQIDAARTVKPLRGSPVWGKVIKLP